MDREEVIEFLNSQLKMLREEKVADLIPLIFRSPGQEELEAYKKQNEITDRLEYAPLEEFCNEQNLCLTENDIPEGYGLELAIYLNANLNIKLSKISGYITLFDGIIRKQCDAWQKLYAEDYIRYLAERY